MKKEKYSLKEDIKEELKDSSSTIKSTDLIIDDNIDDKYTSYVLNKYKDGQMKNKWFIWSGVFSILISIACVIGAIAVGVSFAISSDYLRQLASQNQFNYDAEKTKTIIICVVLAILGIIGLYVGLKIKSYSHYSKEELIENVFSIIVFSILQVIFGGVIFVILTLIGYFVGIGSDYGVIYYNRIDNSSQKQKQLMDAKVLYQNELIDYEEYTKLKSKILHGTDIFDEY